MSLLDGIVTSSGSEDDDIVHSSDYEVRNQRHLFVNEETSSVVGTDEGKVRFQTFNAGGDSSSSDEDQEENPWQFPKLIRREMKNRLPNNYNLKRWRKPSRILVDSVMQLLETNSANSVDIVFEKYDDELMRLLRGKRQEIELIKEDKEKMLGDILQRIEKKLRFSKFPSRLTENDLNIEYIYEKRRFLQERYVQELRKAEILEQEIAKERKLLQDAKELTENIQQTNDKRLTDKLVRNEIHPVLLQSISDSLDSATQKIAYRRDVIELNLENSHQIHQKTHSIRRPIAQLIDETNQLTSVFNDQNRLHKLEKMIL